jgi:hypothetical protein
MAISTTTISVPADRFKPEGAASMAAVTFIVISYYNGWPDLGDYVPNAPVLAKSHARPEG